MTPLELAMLAVLCACLAYMVGYVWRLADTLTIDGDPAGDDPHGPEDGLPPTPLDDLPPDSVDWNALLIDAQLWAITHKEHA